RHISCGSIKPWVATLEASPFVELEVWFIDRDRRGHALPIRYHYTNTCEDFEATLVPGAALDLETLGARWAELDLAVPMIHGAFGEDGELQQVFERYGVRYLFSTPDALALSMDKARCHAALAAAGLRVPQHVRIEWADWSADPGACADLIHGGLPAPVDRPLAAIKPAAGGSSLGVSLAQTADDLEDAIELAFEYDDVALAEEFLDGHEFSVVVLESEDGAPVALPPTAIEKRGATYDERAKYLYGGGAELTTPHPRTDRHAELQASAVRAFEALGMRHMARVDGFLVGDRVYVTDVNGISGFGFSSFAFQQASLCGLDHAALIEHLIRRALPPERRPARGELFAQRSLAGGGQRLTVIFGGATSERQVSRQSGVFVGLCLASMGYAVDFALLDRQGQFTPVGLFPALQHEVEGIEALLADREGRAGRVQLGRDHAERLGLPTDAVDRLLLLGEPGDLERTVAQSRAVFLGLHGGIGEDGTLQSALDALGKPYNGSGSQASALGADKYIAHRTWAAAGIEGVRLPRQRLLTRDELAARFEGGSGALFEELRAELGGGAIVAKPAADGCSTGVKLLRSGADLEVYARGVLTLEEELPAGAFGEGSAPLKMPEGAPDRWLFEEAMVDEAPQPFPEAPLTAAKLRRWFEGRRYIELTVAVLDLLEQGLTAAEPSITLAAGESLSLEEKFQQRSVRQRILALAEALGIEGYARIDVFYDRERDEVLPIEPNTLCGLTEATVFYTQALASFDLPPPAALHRIVQHGIERAARS
ncbi:MAG: ATP-grasp domain-containing protein, partial [Planctomycetota bacterium]